MGVRMRLCTFQVEGSEPRLGAWTDGGVVDVSRLAFARGAPEAPFASMRALIEAGPILLDRLRTWLDEPLPDGVPVHSRSSVALLAPLLDPPRLRCFSIYEKHLTQAFRQVLRHRTSAPVFGVVNMLGLIKPPRRFFEAPTYYKGNHCAISGPDQEIPWPSYSEMLDYELELCIVIGAKGKDIAPESARSHVFGYTIMNDFSARDALMGEVGFGPSGGPAKGKDFDGSNAIGPWIVTADEVPEPTRLSMEVRVNGVLKGAAKAGDGAHSFESLIAYASRGETLIPGELLSCGAVGDGTGIERWEFLSPGDVVELTIEKIGTLSNRLGARPPHQPLIAAPPKG